jgi:hypothetical protein
MKNLIGWLEENTCGSRNCADEFIICGTQELFYSYSRQNGCSDPISLQLHHGVQGISKRRFLLSGEEKSPIHVQFVRKVNQTPFFYALLNTTHHDIHILDFYSWLKPNICFRLFYCTTCNQDCLVEIESYADEKGVYDLFERLNISNRDKNQGTKVYLYILSTQPVDAKYRDIETIYNLLTKMTNRCRMNHISRFFNTADQWSMYELDWFWSQQKFIEPDLSLAEAAEENRQITPYIDYLAACFGWNFNTNAITDENLFYSERYMVVDIPLLIRAFNENRYEDEVVYRELNYWWAIYSLPVMERKFNQLMEDAPHFLTLIALLAIQYQLPWQELLVNRLLSASIDFIYKLVLWLAMRILVRQKDSLLYIHPGFKWDNNIKEIKRSSDSFRIKYTKFGVKHYVSLYHKNKRIYQADHCLALLFDTSNRRLCSRAAVPAGFKLTDRVQEVSLVVADKQLSQPLLFRKGEIFFFDLRLRWILKKRRFQITLFSNRKDIAGIMNGTKLDFTQVGRKKVYLETSSGRPLEHMVLFDRSGRMVHKRDLSGFRTVKIDGWLMDQRGIFCETINYKIGLRQHTVECDSSGRITAMVKMAVDKKNMMITIRRGMRFEKQIPLCFDPHWEKFLFIHIYKWPFRLEISIDSSLKENLPKIRDFFTEILAMIPRINLGKQDLIHLTDGEAAETGYIIKVGKQAHALLNILQNMKNNIPDFE